MALPQIILLNGTTSAGKTSIAHALQARLPGLWLHVGVDHFIQMTPLKFHGAPEGFQFAPQPDGALPLNIGPTGQRVLAAFRTSVASIARSGANVIVDEVILSPKTLGAWLDALQNLDVFFVGVHCSLEEAQRREQARGDRGIGQVRAQFDIVHAGADYDFTIDTTADSPESGAGAIAAALEKRVTPTAFDRLRARS